MHHLPSGLQHLVVRGEHHSAGLFSWEPHSPEGGCLGGRGLPAPGRPWRDSRPGTDSRGSVDSPGLGSFWGLGRGEPCGWEQRQSGADRARAPGGPGVSGGRSGGRSRDPSLAERTPPARPPSCRARRRLRAPRAPAGALGRTGQRFPARRRAPGLKPNPAPLPHPRELSRRRGRAAGSAGAGGRGPSPAARGRRLGRTHHVVHVEHH